MKSPYPRYEISPLAQLDARIWRNYIYVATISSALLALIPHAIIAISVWLKADIPAASVFNTFCMILAIECVIGLVANFRFSWLSVGNRWEKAARGFLLCFWQCGWLLVMYVGWVWWLD